MTQFQLKKTGDEYPEQYDVFCNGRLTAYLRVRHGVFTCHRSDDLKIIFEEEVKGEGGKFEDHEREPKIAAALEALHFDIFGSTPTL